MTSASGRRGTVHAAASELGHRKVSPGVSVLETRRDGEASQATHSLSYDNESTRRIREARSCRRPKRMAKTHQVHTKPAPGTVVAPVHTYDDEQKAKMKALLEVRCYGLHAQT